MRLWHKDLIPVLPRQQLLGQWRECCLIAKNIAENGSPNHILVNRIMNYSINQFYRYCGRVFAVMVDRGYRCNPDKLLQYAEYWGKFSFWNSGSIAIEELFKDWHNERYLTQCLFNLQEKYDCGGIPEDEYMKIVRFEEYRRLSLL